jgi:SAM-dependent methyltransferase
VARYDGFAQWYDEYVTEAATALTAQAQQALLAMLGPGPGIVLDLGCGTGVHIPPLAQAGWSVVGTDVSTDQLRIARDKVGRLAEDLVEADAARMPFDDDSFDAVVSVFTHTDIDDLGAVFREAVRVLRPTGRLVYVGTHPCFVNPFVERSDERRILHSGYRRAGWHHHGPGLRTEGIRSRVGVRHVPLAELVAAVLASGLTLEHLDEPGTDDPPTLVALSGRPLR